MASILDAAPVLAEVPVDTSVGRRRVAIGVQTGDQEEQEPESKEDEAGPLHRMRRPTLRPTQKPASQVITKWERLMTA